MESQIQTNIMPDPSNINSENKKFEFPAMKDIDEIVEKYDLQGNHIELKPKKRIVPTKFARPSTYEDAKAIVKIYNAVYQGTFPYPEMLDPAFVFSSFSDPNYYWGIFKTVKRNKIIGCYTVTIDPETRTGYLRGLNVHPSYQARVGIREMASAVMRNFLEDHIDKIDKWYIEARTAHTTVQYLGRTGDLHPYALMLEKDVFYNQRESDAFLLSFRRHIYEGCRIFPKGLPAPLLPFYDHANTMMERSAPVEIIPIADESFPTDVARIRELKVGITTDEYKYTHFIIHDPTTGDTIQGLFTPSVKTVEKIKFQLTDPSLVGTMLAKFHEVAWSLGAEYIEWIVLVADNLLISYFLQHPMYIIQGYLPAWVPSKKIKGKYEDAVMFGFSRHPIITSNLQLIEESQALLDIIMQALTHYREMKVRNCLT
ncbi:MAG: GNAT family N-acetyltransferase [Candidatus Lokiarchaeota archaeon]|nr:GNAT family N-acetyltransferase [Candidatus Harpocratesius repetitus]